jgi:hypothetical protein
METVVPMPRHVVVDLEELEVSLQTVPRVEDMVANMVQVLFQELHWVVLPHQVLVKVDLVVAQAHTTTIQVVEPEVGIQEDLLLTMDQIMKAAVEVPIMEEPTRLILKESNLVMDKL